MQVGGIGFVIATRMDEEQAAYCNVVGIWVKVGGETYRERWRQEAGAPRDGAGFQEGAVDLPQRHRFLPPSRSLSLEIGNGCWRSRKAI
jgi:hypothetical protein